MRQFYKGVVLGSVVSIVVLMASTALAGSGIGAVFNLGKKNTVNGTSGLMGSTTGRMLQVTNRGQGPALGLTVEPGKAPMTVSSTARVANLNADRVDGLHAGRLAKVVQSRCVVPWNPGTESVLADLPGWGTIVATIWGHGVVTNVRFHRSTAKEVTAWHVGNGTVSRLFGDTINFDVPDFAFQLVLIDDTSMLTVYVWADPAASVSSTVYALGVES